MLCIFFGIPPNQGKYVLSHWILLKDDKLRTNKKYYNLWSYEPEQKLKNETHVSRRERN